MVTHSKRLPVVISGACDGEIKVWNVTSKECSCSVQAHTGFVRGMGINQVRKLKCCVLLNIGEGLMRGKIVKY